MVSPEHANGVKAQAGGVAPDKLAAPSGKLIFNFRQLLEYLNANVDEAVNIEGELHEIKEESNVLLNWQIRAAGIGKCIQHLDHLSGALPRDHVLVEVAQVLKLVSDALKIELVARVLLHFAPFSHVDAKLLAE